MSDMSSASDIANNRGNVWTNGSMSPTSGVQAAWRDRLNKNRNGPANSIVGNQEHNPAAVLLLIHSAGSPGDPEKSTSETSKFTASQPTSTQRFGPPDAKLNQHVQ